jgi:hypothetical protein
VLTKGFMIATLIAIRYGDGLPVAGAAHMAIGHPSSCDRSLADIQPAARRL